MPAVGALAPMVLAIVALCILVAGYLLVELIGHALQSGINIPGVGFVVGWIERGFQAAMNAMLGLLSGTVRGIESLLTRPARMLVEAFTAVRAALSAMSTWIHQIVDVYIPQLYGYVIKQIDNALQYAHDLAYSLYYAALQWAGAAINNLAQVLWNAIGQVQAWVQSIENALASEIYNVYRSLTNLTEQLFQAAMAELAAVRADLLQVIDTAVTRLEQYAQDLANWAVQTAYQMVIGWAIPYISSAIALAIGGVDAIIAGEMQDVWPRILDNVKAAAGAIPAGIPWILDKLGALPAAIPADIATAIGDLALAVDIPIEYLARCGAKLCENLRGFGDEVSNLADDALIAMIIAAAAAAVADPEGAAKVTATVGKDIMEPIADGFKALVGR